MSKTQTAGGAQDGDAGKQPKANGQRMRCSSLNIEPGPVNGIRFVRLGAGLVSEAVDPDDEQVKRLCQLPEFTLGDVTAAEAREIDALVMAQEAADRAEPATAAGAGVEQALLEQQAINLAVSKERDAALEKLRVAELKLADADVSALQARIETKDKTIAELRADVERLTADNQRLGGELQAAKDTLATATAANEALGKQIKELERMLAEATAPAGKPEPAAKTKNN